MKSNHIFYHITQWKKLNIVKTNQLFFTQLSLKLYD